MPEQFRTPAKNKAFQQLMDELRAKQGPNLLQTLMGQGVPESYTELNPETGRMQRKYKMPPGQPDPEFLAMRAKNDQMAKVEPYGPQDSQFIPPEYDMMGKRVAPGGLKGLEAPTPAPMNIASVSKGGTAIDPSMPGPQGMPGQDKWDRLGEIAPELEKNDRNRMILRIMEGLTRAGAEASNVPLITELLAGKGRGPTDQTNADMLRAFIDKGAKADKEALSKAAEADNPMVKAAREETGKDFKTIAEVQQYYAMRKVWPASKEIESWGEDNE